MNIREKTELYATTEKESYFNAYFSDVDYSINANFRNFSKEDQEQFLEFVKEVFERVNNEK